MSSFAALQSIVEHCGALWSIVAVCEDDSQNHEVLHASCVCMCQGTGDGNLHIHFNVYFKMKIALCISIQLLVSYSKEEVLRKKKMIQELS